MEAAFILQGAQGSPFRLIRYLINGERGEEKKHASVYGQETWCVFYNSRSTKHPKAGETKAFRLASSEKKSRRSAGTSAGTLVDRNGAFVQPRRLLAFIVLMRGSNGLLKDDEAAGERGEVFRGTSAFPMQIPSRVLLPRCTQLSCSRTP